MHKIIIRICIYSLLMLILVNQPSVYAIQVKGTDGAGSEGTVNNDDWITDAFSAVKSFFKEEVEDDLGIIATPLDLFRRAIKAINRVLLVFLAGLSTISLAIVGIRYLLSINDSKEKGKAIGALHTTVKGMAFGFGAFLIWRIAMGIVEVIISNL